MITAIAIDDEPDAIEVIKHHIAKIKTIELIATFHNANDALKFLKDNFVDLVFLDINMPHMSGLEMLQELKSKPLLIFTTAYAEFAIDSYAHNAIDYLLKPFEFDRFLLAINKAKDQIEFQNTNQKNVFIKDGFKTINIAFDTILFVKGSGNYLDITTTGKVYSPRMTFIDLLRKLPSSNFIRIHQSYLINCNHIDQIENNHIYIESYKIPISNSYKDILYQRLNV